MDEFPQGYGKLAAIEDSDPNFLIYRKFGWLRNRVLLHHQDELAEYEEQLENLDNFEKQNDPRNLISRRRDDATEGSRRRELVSQIEEKLAAYGKNYKESSIMHLLISTHRRTAFTTSADLFY